VLAEKSRRELLEGLRGSKTNFKRRRREKPNSTKLRLGLGTLGSHG